MLSDQDKGYMTLAEGMNEGCVDGVETFCENMFDANQINVEISTKSSTVAMTENNKGEDAVAFAEVSTNNNELIEVTQSIETISHDNVSRTN